MPRQSVASNAAADFPLAFPVQCVSAFHSDRWSACLRSRQSFRCHVPASCILAWRGYHPCPDMRHSRAGMTTPSKLERLRIGLVGLGAAGRAFLPAVRAHDRFKLAAVAEPDEETRSEIC